MKQKLSQTMMGKLMDCAFLLFATFSVSTVSFEHKLVAEKHQQYLSRDVIYLSTGKVDTRRHDARFINGNTEHNRRLLQAFQTNQNEIASEDFDNEVAILLKERHESSIPDLFLILQRD